MREPGRPSPGHEPDRVARHVAEATRAACIETAVRAYQDAAISGLCGEGALEAAVSAMRMLDIDEIVTQQQPVGAAGQ